MMMEVSRPPEYASTTFSGMNSPWSLQAGGKTVNAAAEQHQQNGFLYVQAILGLIENDRAGRIDHRTAHLFSAMRRQTMHEQSVGRGMVEQLLIHLIWAEDILALRSFALLAHAGPHVGVDGVGPRHRLVNVGQYLDLGRGRRGDLFG